MVCEQGMCSAFEICLHMLELWFLIFLAVFWLTSILLMSNLVFKKKKKSWGGQMQM